LRAGELLTITYSDLVNPQLPFEGRIREDGTITLLLNQTFTAVGKTIVEFEKEIRDRYVPKLFVNLTATVRVHDRFFYVSGEVRQPSRQEYRSDITVLGAIAASGGFTDFANRKKVQVIRADNRKVKVNCEMARERPELDLPIYPNDRVIVPRRFW
jgi:polysaccharide export outer membrane protein